MVFFKNSKLVKIIFGTGFATTVKMLTGLITNKFFSILLGPAGIAITSQFANFTSIFTMFSTGATQNGVVKYLSSEQEIKNKENIAHTAISISIICSLVLTLIIVGLNKIITQKVFFGGEYSFVIIIFGFLLILFGLNATFYSIINGYQEYKKLVYNNIYTSLLGLVLSCILVYFLKIEGALIALATNQSVVFVYTYFTLRREPWLRSYSFRWPLDSLITRKLLSYSGLAILSMITLPLSQMILRGWISRGFNTNTAGLWDAVNKISGMLQMFITTTLSVYFFPKISESGTKKIIIKETIHIIRILLFFFSLAFLFIFFFKKTIVIILFSHKFIEIENYLLKQTIGDFFKMLSWVFSYLTLAKAKFVKFIFLEFSFLFLFLLNNFLLLKHELNGIINAYILTYFIYCIMAFIVYLSIIKNYD